MELRKRFAQQRRIEVEIEVRIQVEMELKMQPTTQANTQLTIPVPELLRMLRRMLCGTESLLVAGADAETGHSLLESIDATGDS